MRGNTEHIVLNMTNGTPFVCLSNRENQSIWQGFDNHAEVETFIHELQIAALEAFGPKRLTMKQLLKDQKDDSSETE